METIDVEQRVAQARNYFTSGYNCAQSVALTFADIFGVDKELMATMSAPFGGGMGRLREVCGAVSGMTIAAGFIVPANDITNRVAKSQNYALVQEFAEAFRAQNRSIICRELLGLTVRKEDPTPSERTKEYYKKRPCAELVADAAKIVAEHLSKQA
ncbi:MAG: C-GCAxxG-C-C family protein [Rikenellaceae bacterium]